ncbi:MAG TPA: DNA repair protein RecO [Patescibacteria group bacterium]|nr:DNA repair protein RecO [Patescibacteria group bacterium]
MNNQQSTQGIILARTDYGEADRILTLLTPGYGKLRLIAKGVRRVKSKLAGGIELFSVSDLMFIKGRGEIGTLVSARLDRHFRHIVKDLDRTMLGYELIRLLNKNTEDETEGEYFELLETGFESLDDVHIPRDIIEFWFYAQLLRLGGQAPNLHTDASGAKLQAGQAYSFDVQEMTFAVAPEGRGRFTADDIKFLRLAFAGSKPKLLNHVEGAPQLAAKLAPLVTTMLQNNMVF